MCAAQSVLIRSKGASLVTAEELAEVKAPPAEGRWFPLSHSTVLNRVLDTLDGTGLSVVNRQLALSQDRAKFFGTLDLSDNLSRGVTLAVGIRNSVDKSFPLGFCAGNRVMCCENLAFSAELLVKRRHTRFGERRFVEDIAAAMPKLTVFREQEAKRIAVMNETEVSNIEADSLILRAYEKGIVQSRFLSAVIREWREPSFTEFEPRTMWSLFNAFTTILGANGNTTRNPQGYAAMTMRLNALVAPPPRVIETTAVSLAV